ncbi:MAG TPA: class I SAM-dependent methyltransferase [Stellaceae bacterium]|nr:class I SAM-dependent methyltransferase [Stellaceae bacterium]
MASLHWREPRFLRCRRCGVLFRHPLPTEAALAELYTTGWRNNRHTETGGTDAEIARILVERLSELLPGRRFLNTRILDYGAGRGAVALELMKVGANIAAVEPFGCEFLTSLGITAYRDLAQLPEGSQFDGIVCLDVVEHLREPRRALADLYRRLSSQGWLLIQTPNIASLPAMLKGRHWHEATIPGHLVLFTPAALRKALRESGFRRVRRLRWVIHYPRASLLRALVHSGMQALAIGGNMHMVAYRN